MPQFGRKRRRSRKNSTGSLWTVGLAVAGALLFGVVLLTIRTGSTGDGSLIDVEPTVVAGRSNVAGVDVDATEVDLGRVPLDRVVRQVFRLRNTSGGAVALGQPAIETLEGC